MIAQFKTPGEFTRASALPYLTFEAECQEKAVTIKTRGATTDTSLFSSPFHLDSQ